jgi:lipoyl(octanoyl) transferase
MSVTVSRTIEAARLVQPGFSPHPVRYGDGLRLQLDIHADVVAGRSPNTLVLLEHEPVFTAGRRTTDDERPADGTPVVDVDRGGKITWHGPGQLVGYPIVRLHEPIDVVAYVRGLEGILIEVLSGFGITGERIEGRSGVWVQRPGLAAAKIGAIGIRVNDGVTRHGFALNCTNDLAPFSEIVPCGIRDAGVTSIREVTGRDVEPEAVAAVVARAFGATDVAWA